MIVTRGVVSADDLPPLARERVGVRDGDDDVAPLGVRRVVLDEFAERGFPAGASASDRERRDFGPLVELDRDCFFACFLTCFFVCFLGCRCGRLPAARSSLAAEPSSTPTPNSTDGSDRVLFFAAFRGDCLRLAFFFRAGRRDPVFSDRPAGRAEDRPAAFLRRLRRGDSDSDSDDALDGDTQNLRQLDRAASPRGCEGYAITPGRVVSIAAGRSSTLET